MGDGGKTIRLWDVETGTHLKALTGHINSVSCVVFSKNGKILYSADYSDVLFLWNLQTGQTIRKKRRTWLVSGI